MTKSGRRLPTAVVQKSREKGKAERAVIQLCLQRVKSSGRFNSHVCEEKTAVLLAKNIIMIAKIPMNGRRMSTRINIYLTVKEQTNILKTETSQMGRGKHVLLKLEME